MTGERTTRKPWSRADDAAYREAVAEAAPATDDRESILADMGLEIEEVVKRALKRLEGVANG